MPSDLKIQVVVDASQVAAGMSGVTSTVEQATARIKAAFGSVASAPEGIRNALLVLQNASRMSADAVSEATSAIAGLGAQSEAAAGEVEQAAARVSGLDRAMAMATVRIAGFAGGAGMLGSALGRVGAMSETLAPLLAAAFPVIGAIALADIVGSLYEKLRSVALEADVNAEAWQKIDHEIAAAMEGAENSIQRLEVRLTELTQGKLAALRLAFTQIGDGAVEMGGKLQSIFDGIAKQLDKERTIGEKMKDFVTTAFSFQVFPTQGEVAQKFFSDLSKTLDAKGLTAGIEQVNAEIVKLNLQLQQTPDDTKLAEYRDRLVEVLAILERRQNEKTVQQNTNLAEQAREEELELEKERERVDKLNEAFRKLGDEKQKVAKATEDAASAELAWNVAATKASGPDLKGAAERADADEKFRQDRINDARAAAIAEIDTEEEVVRERERLGQISNQQAEQQLVDLEAKKLQIEKQYLDERIATIMARLSSDDAATYVKDLAEWSKLLSEKQKAEDNYQKNRQKIVDQSATQEQQVWNRLAQGITRQFDSAIQGLVSGTERWGTAFGRLLDDMLAKFIEAMLQMLEQWILTHVLMLTVKKSAQQEEVLSDAKAAAASAWKAVVGIPIIGPVLAPAAAAAAFAGVEAFSAAGGMDMVPADDTLALLHKREMVLPADLADRVRSGTGGSSVSVNYSPNVSAVDSSGVDALFRQHSKSLVKAIQRELRRTNQL